MTRVASPLRWLLGLGCACCVATSGACTVESEVGSDCSDPAACMAAGLSADGIGGGSTSSTQGKPPAKDGPSRAGPIEKLDLLFVVDASPSAAPARDALSSQLARMLSVLSSGDRDGNGFREFRPVHDVHAGVISSDLGLSGAPARPDALGGDGLLSDYGCGSSSSPRADQPFVSLTAPERAAVAGEQLACMVEAVPESSSAFVQPLEATLKALWPSGQEGLSALGSILFNVGQGHGDMENQGFSRPDSLLVVLVLSTADDCSVSDLGFFGRAGTDGPASCAGEQGSLYDPNRYVNALEGLRPGAADLVMFFAIAGVPPDLVGSEALRMSSFELANQRDAFYQALLASPAMQPTFEPGNGGLVPACEAPPVSGYPAARLVQTAQDFAANGLVQSVCDGDLTGAVDAILRSIARRLGPAPI